MKTVIFVAINLLLGALGPGVLKIAVSRIFRFNGPPPTLIDWAFFWGLIAAYILICITYNFIAFKGSGFGFRCLIFLVGAIIISAVFFLVGSYVLR